MTEFADMAEKFAEITERIVWCTVATVDRQGRPRSRILHPIWEGNQGWIATGRDTLKAKHLAQNSFVSLTYWDPQHEMAIIECDTRWLDDAESKQTLWDKLLNAPEPIGYNPQTFWPSADDAGFGVLELIPWRLATWSLDALTKGEPAQVWRPE